MCATAHNVRCVVGWERDVGETGAGGFLNTDKMRVRRHMVWLSGHVYFAILLDLEEFFRNCWKLFHHDRYDRVKCLPAPDKTRRPFEQLVFVFKAQIIE